MSISQKTYAMFWARVVLEVRAASTIGRRDFILRGKKKIDFKDEREIFRAGNEPGK